MKVKTYEGLAELNNIVEFITNSESLYKDSSKEKNAFIISTYFSNENIGIYVEDIDLIIGHVLITFPKRYDDTAFIGFYEVRLDNIKRKEISKLLLDKVEEVARAKNIKKIVGPINFNTWLENRYKYNSSKHFFCWEPNNPKDYREDFEEFGMITEMEYISNFYKDSTHLLEHTKAHYNSCLEKGYQFRDFHLENEQEITELYELSLKCFDKNHYYTPISFEQHLKTHIIPLRGHDLQYCSVIYKEDKVYGWIFSFDDNQRIIIKTILIDPDTRQEGLASAMLHETLRRGAINGIKRYAGALVRKGNESEYFFRTLGTPEFQHTYKLLVKNI